MDWQYLDIREMTEEQFESWYAMADRERQKKCDAYHSREDRLRAIAGDHLARMGIAARCGVKPDSICFARTADGKPYAVDLDIHFNISHSGSFVFCAVSDRSVGIDVEQMRPVKAKLTNKVCTPEELAYLMDADGWGETLTGEAMVRFFRIWTTKEAYFKWAGTGITDLKAFDTLDQIRQGRTFEKDGHMVSIYE